MKIFKISPDTLFNLAFDVIASLEKILSVSSLLPDKEIYSLLEEDLSYSLTHIRDVFKLATNISLRKYITRRKYTNILLQMSFEDFDKLTMHATVFKIQKFKSKCLREFPLKDVHFVDNPFLIFDNQNVILNLSFFDKIYYK